MSPLCMAIPLLVSNVDGWITSPGWTAQGAAAESMPPMPFTRPSFTFGTWRGPAFAAELPHGLDDGKDPVHAGVRVGEAPPLVVDRELAARRRSALLEEMHAFAGLQRPSASSMIGAPR